MIGLLNQTLYVIKTEVSFELIEIEEILVLSSAITEDTLLCRKGNETTLTEP